MKEEDYPALYRASDSASKETQSAYLRLVKLQFALLVGGAALGTLGITSTSSAVFAALAFIASISTSVLIAFRRYEDKWYRARAVAESVKTSAWRFMMRAEPYDADDATARKAFRATLRDILKQHTDLGAELSGPVAGEEQLTETMISNRQSGLVERKDVYLRERIDEQRLWYADKSAWNGERAKFWLWAFVGLQALAVVLVILRIVEPTFQYWPVEVLAVAAACVLTWLQVRRFRELSSAYALTAHEIGVLRGEIEGIGSDGQFSHFVGDAESAFSREHTQWIARRDTVI